MGSSGGYPSAVHRLIILSLLAVSSLATIIGMRALLAFDGTAGQSGRTPIEWPAASRIRRTPNRPELLIFAHQFCSCTPATFNELARMRATVEPAVTILLSSGPGGAVPESTVWRSAAALPGARAVWDDRGREASLFGARTSGYVVLYSAAGKLLFHGGVTGSRGHEGGNRGIDALTLALDSGRPAGRVPPVFGCALGTGAVR